MDARSLLRAKKAEAKINHPYATYSASGQLRCSICAVPVKQWDAHLLTKQHRTSAAREKLEQDKRAAAAAAGSGKSKRPADDDSTSGQESKKARVGNSALPAGFFSSNNAPVNDNDDEEEEEEDVQAGPSTSTPVPTPAPVPPPVAKTGDAELDDFLSSLNDNDDIPEPSTSIPAATTSTATRRKIPAYKEIAPGQASYEAAPVRIAPPDASEENTQAADEPEESEADRRARLEREEREEIVARLEEEERAQEDADSRVASLKQRMEMIRKRREAKAKSKGTTSGDVTNDA